MTELLLLACSKDKAAAACRALDLYQGALFKAGARYAGIRGLRVVILSAKHGIICPERMTEPYDDVLTNTYRGPWPSGAGFYLGGPLYFANAPIELKPLVPKGRIGDMVSNVARLDYMTRDEIFARNATRGVVQAIYETMTVERLTKAQLLARLEEEFGPQPGLKTTINCQLLQSRMGRQRQCTVYNEAGVFWLVPDPQNPKATV